MATALPTIAENLHISPSHYTWVSVAYLLAQTTLQPVYGQLADKLGRKVNICGTPANVLTRASRPSSLRASSSS